MRQLKADEIECRTGTCKKNGFSILLYKNARVDMSILDEMYGITGWKRSHELIDGHLFCTVSIYDNKKKEWVSKQDVGTESNTEATKGEASDSFKRACFNVGIGRELYTAPFIWINPVQNEIKEINGKFRTYARLSVKSIGYDDNGYISLLEIIDDKNNIRYSFGGVKNTPPNTGGEDPFKEKYKVDDKIKASFTKCKESQKLTAQEIADYIKRYKAIESHEDAVLLLVEMEGLVNGR